MLRIREVLQPEFAQVPERHAIPEFRPRQGRGRIGEQHLTAVARGGNARGAVDVNTHVIGARVGGRGTTFAGVHTHPDAHRRAVRKDRRAERTLRGRGRAHRSRHDREDDEERVPIYPNLDPAVLDGLAEDPRVRLEDVLIPVRAKLVLELGRALDVGEEKCEGAGRQPPPLAHPHLILLFLAFAKTEASL